MNDVINESDISIDGLSIELSRAAISNDIRSEDTLYVHEQGMFPFWVRLMQGQRMVQLHTYLPFKQRTDDELYAFCNKVNDRLIMPSVSLHKFERDQGIENRMVATYPILYRDGLIRSHLIRACRIFSDAIRQIENEIDSRHRYLLGLGEKEDVIELQ
jgi:Putative bacterial sensory transduction regulator